MTLKNDKYSQYKPEQKEKVLNEVDYINSKKYNFSLRSFLKRHKKGTTDNVIAHFLCTTPEDVGKIYNDAILKIRQHFKIDL